MCDNYISVNGDGLQDLVYVRFECVFNRTLPLKTETSVVSHF